MKTVIDFYADWCGPCQAMKPILSKVLDKQKDKYELKKVDVDEEQDKAQDYGVMSIPTLVILDSDGQEVDRRMGAMSESQLESWLNQHN